MNRDKAAECIRAAKRRMAELPQKRRDELVAAAEAAAQQAQFHSEYRRP